MPNTNTHHVGKLLNGRFAFLQEFLKHPLQIGSVIPSSQFLERRIVEAAGIAGARTVVELGPGTGGTTRALLRALPAHARLLSIEINPHFHAMVSEIEDRRFIAHLGSAADLEEIVDHHGLDVPDAIVSGIPFSTLPDHVGSQILAKIAAVLAPSGRFVAYQVSSQVAKLCRPYLGRERSATEILNIPPMRVYQWEKRAIQ